MGPGLKSPGENANGNPGCTPSSAEPTSSHKPPATAGTRSRRRPVAERTIDSTLAFQDAWKPIGCTLAFSASLRIILSSWPGLFSTFNEPLVDPVSRTERFQLPVGSRELVVIAAGSFPILYMERTS